MTDREIKVLDHGYVALVDVMGDDRTPAKTARTSFRNRTERTAEEDARLTDYLVRNRHCYCGSMQVLTTRGWVAWEECADEETFLVPDPSTRTYRTETLPVERFDADEEMITFENARMSFAVTADHRMWFKPNSVGEFGIHRAGEMSRWGHFDTLVGYRVASEASDEGRLVGFFLGDGSYSSLGTVCFHLRKERKKVWLRELCSRLGIEVRERGSATYSDAVVITIDTPEFLRSALGQHLDSRCKEKQLAAIPEDGAFCAGVFDGLVNSDGHLNDERKRIEFSSASPRLRHLFELLAARSGYDAHGKDNGRSIYAYAGARCSLESRGDYFGRRWHRGRVYCATTSTGLLAVRGGPDKFGFVCGNTTPIEFCQVLYYVKLPIFVARQFIRHRTASVNEVSYRYVKAAREFYVPEPERCQRKSETNKQGSSSDVVDDPEFVRQVIFEHGERSFDVYEALLAKGLAPELARIVLPCGTYTEWYWQQDLHNLLHLLRLRLDPHAQYEIRVYAQAMLDLIRPVFPTIIASWERTVGA